ncbi:MAG: hypothetical protein R3F11_12830 [Verrucomicrobiales bacterium]
MPPASGIRHPASGIRHPAAGGWRLAAGGWRLALAVGGWRLAAGGWRRDTIDLPQLYNRHHAISASTINPGVHSRVRLCRHAPRQAHPEGASP